jgi:methionine synthase II (cobalamin-independent)
MTESTVNYTPEMVAILKQNAPIDYAKAQTLAPQLDRGVRSIIAKCKREGIEYISKPSPARKKSAPSKADLVGAISKALDCGTLDGLEKATGQSLAKLLEHIS